MYLHTFMCESVILLRILGYSMFRFHILRDPRNILQLWNIMSRDSSPASFIGDNRLNTIASR